MRIDKSTFSVTYMYAYYITQPMYLPRYVAIELASTMIQSSQLP